MMFKCVTKELKKKIFSGLDKTNNSMEHKMMLIDIILLYAEGLTNKEISEELGYSIPFTNKRLADIRHILDELTLKDIEDLHNNNLGIRPNGIK